MEWKKNDYTLGDKSIRNIYIIIFYGIQKRIYKDDTRVRGLFTRHAAVLPGRLFYHDWGDKRFHFPPLVSTYKYNN